MCAFKGIAYIHVFKALHAVFPNVVPLCFLPIKIPPDGVHNPQDCVDCKPDERPLAGQFLHWLAYRATEKDDGY